MVKPAFEPGRQKARLRLEKAGQGTGLGVDSKVRLVRNEEYGYLCAKKSKVYSFNQEYHHEG